MSDSIGATIPRYRMQIFLFKTLLLLLLAFAGVSTSHAETTMMDKIKALEPTIGAHPPNIHSREEFEAVKARYEDLKSELDRLVRASPTDQSLLFMRGYLQSMGHNFDYPGAWQGATDDLKAVLVSNRGDIPAMLALGKLWVNSNPALAPDAEKLFRGAQCYKGSEPLEEAQNGLFFALYFQGRMSEALRQIEYLAQTWPQKEQYQRLREITRGVVGRGGEVEDQGAVKFAMASCGN